MQSPKRLLEDDASPFERQLLEAVRGERPSPELAARMAQGLGFAEASGGASVSSGASRGATPSAGVAAKAAVPGGAAAGKLAFWSFAGAGAIAAGIFFASEPEPASRETSGAPSRTEAASSTERAPESAAPAPSPTARADASLREEIALVDELRAAVQAGRQERALSLFQRHRERFVEGALTEEVEALRRRIDPGVLRGAPPSTEATSPR